MLGGKARRCRAASSDCSVLLITVDMVETFVVSNRVSGSPFPFYNIEPKLKVTKM